MEVKCRLQLKYDTKGKNFVSDSEMQITRHDTVFVVITGGFTDKLKDQSAARYSKKADCRMCNT